MGWCHEFGSQVGEGCAHPVTAGESACSCSVCGVRCTGKFSGCAAVWARGPRQITLARPPEPAVTPDVVVAGVVTEDGRGEILEWLRSAFDGVRGDLGLVIEAVGRQQQALDTLPGAEAATTRLIELAEALPESVCSAVEELVNSAVAGPSPERLAPGTELPGALAGYIEDSVREIMRPSQGAMMNRVDAVAAELRESLVEVQTAASELRDEMSRLAAFRAALVADQPELARSVEAATARADGRLTNLAQKMESLSDRPEWQAVRARMPFRRDGPDGP